MNKLKKANDRLNALIRLQEGRVEMIAENIKIYLLNPAGIGEHRKVMEELDSLFDELASAQDKLNCLRLFSFNEIEKK